MIPAGSTLRIEVTSPALVHWTADQWDSVEDTGTRPFAPGLHVARLPTAAYTPGARIQFTLYWPEANRWEGEDFEALIVAGAGGEAVRSAQSD